MCRSRGRKAPARRIVEFSLGAVPMERGASSASLSHEEAGPGSPPPFAESARHCSAETAERIRRAHAPSSVGLFIPYSGVHVTKPICASAKEPRDPVGLACPPQYGSGSLSQIQSRLPAPRDLFSVGSKAKCLVAELSWRGHQVL